MGRKRQPRTKLARVRIRDWKRYLEWAKYSKRSFPEYVARLSRRLPKI